jgi:hypothetical protein
MNPPDYRNRSPEAIVALPRDFDSSWHVFQALSWLDYAKRNHNITALQYAALELRNGIELLCFQIIVNAVGSKLDRVSYVRCTQDATKMYKILAKLRPDYKKLIRFTRICMELDRNAPRIIEWNLSKLMRLHGNISRYLHFQGDPKETWDSNNWFVRFLSLIENTATYLKDEYKSGATGTISTDDMIPEVEDVWHDFRDGIISEDSAKTRLRLAQPILKRRKIVIPWEIGGNFPNIVPHPDNVCLQKLLIAARRRKIDKALKDRCYYRGI